MSETTYTLLRMGLDPADMDGWQYYCQKSITRRLAAWHKKGSAKPIGNEHIPMTKIMADLILWNVQF